MERTSSFSVALEPSLTPNMYQFILSLPSPLTPVVSHTGAAIDANWSETESTYMPIGTLKHIYLYQPSMLVTELYQASILVTELYQPSMLVTELYQASM